ncbi:hypothetical protein M422DRAFT_245106, partial [Sphaerobolus stellatus SS14]
AVQSDCSITNIYGFPGNVDSCFRLSPNTNSDEHWAYIPSLPPDLRDFIQQLTGEACSAPLFTHCKRELVQSNWRILLDEDFRKAYRNGIVIKCADGITRRVYIRLFAYSADYPEKMLMLLLRDKGHCVCPRCLVPKDLIREMGMKRDKQRREKLKREDTQPKNWNVITARARMYGREGKKITSQAVEALLQPTSRVPTINAFSEILPSEYFNKYQIFVVDLLHEFELGVWKSILVHLIRIITKLGKGTLQEFDRRQIPTFGRDTIRTFTTNVSELKKLAARDYEDILQCSLPVFEGLFDEPHATNIKTMLFCLSEWHALAKLRLHTEPTLKRLEEATSKLGITIRRFAAITCAQFDTEELGREFEARKQRLKNMDQAKLPPSRSQALTKKKKSSILKPRSSTSWVITCQQLGGLGLLQVILRKCESAHKKSKQRYPRVSKATPAHGMTRLDQRETNMRNIKINIQTHNLKMQASNNGESHFPPEEQEPLTHNDPKACYIISSSCKHPLKIGPWLHENALDQATEVYDSSFDHLYGRLMNLAAEDDELHITQAQRDQVLIGGRVLYRHQTCRINFTMYDMQRSQDSINPSTSHRDIMLHAQDDPSNVGYHPYWYARVVRIYHCLARLREQAEFEEIHFLWIRWLGRSDIRVRAAINPNFLDQVGFVTQGDKTNMFGFIDPANIIRACHLIPGFHYGQADLLNPTTEGEIKSVGRNDRDSNLDYLHYYVNRYVDWDMYMRYIGGGIGHTIHFDPLAGEAEVIWEDGLPDASALLDNVFLEKLRQQAKQAEEAQQAEDAQQLPREASDEAATSEEDDDDNISVQESDEESEGGWEEGYASP